MIHVCFGLHDADGYYSKFVGTTMASIFENTCAPVTVHILHDNTLTADNRDKFSYLAGSYAQRVKFHDVERLCAEELNFLRDKLANVMSSRFGIGTFYRLLIRKILAPLKISRAIYLDADIIVNIDINELWRQDLANKPLAAVPEVDATLNDMITNKYLLVENFVAAENYFNAGVIMFDLGALGENFFRDGVQFLADHPKCECFDQDILNAFFSTRYLKLAQKFDSFVAAERQMNLSVARKIYHYAGQCIELKLDDEFNRLFLENFSRTPWLNADALGNIAEAFRKSNDEHALIVQRVIQVSVDHSRGFFVGSRNIAAVKMILHVHDDEPIIEDGGQNSFDELIAAMTRERGRLFFICRGDYNKIKRRLMEAGFREFADFISGVSFMAREQCGYMRPEWSLIRGM